MKYWLYSEGNILGPYDPAEMLALPAFSDESLVCLETATGDSADDWKAASRVAEISCMLGSGRAVTASVAAGAYRLENVMSASAPGLEENEYQAGASYSDLLDTIDNILGTRKLEPDTTRPEPADYELAEKFDIRLSRIQEELEAARWEKNLLLEKMRMKEMEEKKNRARIHELEARLKGELRGAEMNARELEQARHLTDLTERSETIKKIEEIKREELSLEKYLVPERDGDIAEPVQRTLEPGTKTLKSVSPSAPISLKRLPGIDGDAVAEDTGVSGLKLKSLGQTQAPAYVYGAKPETPTPFDEPPIRQTTGYDAYGSYSETPLPGPETAPAGVHKGFENSEPLPQQEAGLVYDFTVVTPKPEGTSQQFKIEARPAPSYIPAPTQAQVPASATERVQQSSLPAAPPADKPMEFVPISSQSPVFQQPQVYNPPASRPSQAQAASYSPSSSQATETGSSDSGKEPGPAFGLPDKTLRVVEDAPGKEGGAPAKAARSKIVVADKPAKKGGKTAFVGMLVVFGFIAAGGLGYLFLGDGVSLSQLTMMNFKGRKTAGDAALTEGAAAPSLVAEQAEAGKPAIGVQPAPTGAAEAPAPAQPAEPQAAEKPSKNILRALEIVKSYKLAGGRGSIESWFANSFLAGGAGGANEEWTATPLHGDILVVQYRLLRPKQDPMMYQFEVDAAKGNIVRGINNNAIELLDTSREKTVSAAPVKKTVKQPRVKKPVKSREVAILPLPDEPVSAGGGEADPTGFEQPESNDKVKYLKAQESDEELF